MITLNTLNASLDRIARWGFDDLQKVVAIESSSDEKSATIPSTEGQRKLSKALAEHFLSLGFDAEQDASANLIVRIPPSPGANAPTVALMVHMDTAHGTAALPSLHVVEKWDGSRVKYPKNERLHVDVEGYPLLRAFVGDDLVHGNGDFPFGLDDKLGMAELMTLARVLAADPALPHGEILLVFRPDEEIGRMAAVEGLADTLKQRGVKFGFTIDGLSPFEVNVENFDAARARVRIEGKPLQQPLDPELPRLRVEITGVNTHGATAKSEGYLNSTVVFARAMRDLDPDSVVPVAYASDGLLECNAIVQLGFRGDVESGMQRAQLAFEREVAAARRRGAAVRFTRVARTGPPPSDVAVQLAKLLDVFLRKAGPSPLLSEDSDGTQGYTNPHRAVPDNNVPGLAALHVDFRIRDFTPDNVAARARHVEECAREVGLSAEVVPQYVNMGPALAKFPELPKYAEEAARAAGFEPERRPIRGGTGVDPFLVRGIPVANVGTGYFAPESEKELTSKQNIARHVVWLAHLVAKIAGN